MMLSCIKPDWKRKNKIRKNKEEELPFCINGLHYAISSIIHEHFGVFVLNDVPLVLLCLETWIHELADKAGPQERLTYAYKVQKHILKNHDKPLKRLAFTFTQYFQRFVLVGACIDIWMLHNAHLSSYMYAAYRGLKRMKWFKMCSIADSMYASNFKKFVLTFTCLVLPRI